MKTKLFILLTAATISSCQSDDTISQKDETPKERQDITLTHSETKLVKSNIDFSLKLLNQCCQSENGNTLLSPLGAATLLTMMANGADGNTAHEINATLGQSDYNTDEIKNYYSKLLTLLPELDNTTTVVQANSLWADNGFNIKDDFVQFATQIFDTEINARDFGNGKTKEDINQWCAQKTANCIKEIDCTLDGKMVLVNALYFNGKWAGAFDPTQTVDDKFHGKEQTSNVKMMNKKAIVGYAQNEHFTAISLPYGNEAYSMLIMLPAERIGINEAGRMLAEGEWQKLTTRLGGIPVRLSLPKFNISYETHLIKMLQSLGIKDAFNPAKADFSNLTAEAFCINQFKQKTFISVDESGTEAAGTTWMDTNINSGEHSSISVKLNRPFFFFIQEKSTELILFMGKLEDIKQ